MQKDTQRNKGQEKSDTKKTVEKVGEASGHKMKQVGHDINAGLKENVGVGVGNHSSTKDRVESKKHEVQYEKKKNELKKDKKQKDEKQKNEKQKNEKQKNEKQKNEKSSEETGMVGHKLQEIGHTVNATLKENVGVGVGNYPSKEDKKLANEHQEKYEEKLEENKKKLNEKKEEVKEKVEETKDDVKQKLGETKENVKDKLTPNDKPSSTTSQREPTIYEHKLQEVGHNINATMKEKVGVGIGDYSSEVDRKKAEEHQEGYMDKVKEESNTEVPESVPIVHKIKEVAHTVNANLKEMIGVGVGNYSSEVDRELIDIHHKKYEEKTQVNNTNLDQPNQNLTKKDECSEKNEKECEKRNEKDSEKRNEKESEKRNDKNKKEWTKDTPSENKF